MDLITDRKTAVLAAAKAATAALIVLFLVRKIQADRLVAALSCADTGRLLLGALLLLPNLYLQYVKWALLVRHECPRVPAGTIFYSLLVGSALGLVTPGRIGDLGRSAWVPQCDWARLTGRLLIDKVITLTILYVFGLAGFAVLFEMTPLVLAFTLFAAAAVIAAGLFLIVCPRPLRRRLERRGTGVSVRLLKGAETATPSMLRKLVLYSVLHFFTYCSQFVLFVAAAAPLRLPLAYPAAAAVMFAKSLLPISFGDLGVRESAAVFFFGKAGATAEAAFDGSFLLFCVNVLAPAVIGLVLFLIKRRNGRDR